MSARSELTTHSLRLISSHFYISTDLPSAEFKSLSLVHAQITTYWEKRPLWSLRHSRCCQIKISKDSRQLSQLCGESRRGQVQLNRALQPPRRGRRWQIWAAGARVALALQPAASQTQRPQPALHKQVPAPFAGYLAYRMLICQHVSSLCPLVYSSMELKVNLRGKRWTMYTLCLIGFFSECCDSLESQISCDSSYFCIYLLKALGWYLL